MPGRSTQSRSRSSYAEHRKARTSRGKDMAVEGHRRAGTKDPPSRAERGQKHAARNVDEGGAKKPRTQQVRLQQPRGKARVVFYWTFLTGTAGVNWTVAWSVNRS